ncbi:unnamed protein product [Triticum turgidum subsp. durum]|uniref:Aminoacyl-transfer RNA synthetases class-II family profile domain-containing protein n=1 Tax=Triticum turgidum subsp. durum TaxID=4567 RepID=A0A9R1RLG4_TRITD|nr:unnamed protein product [Triticum turgidum subsp. durum]
MAAAAAACRLLRLAPRRLRSPRHSLFPTPLALSSGWRRYCAAAPPVAAAATPTGDAVGEFRRRIRVAEVKGGEDQGAAWVGKELTVRGWVRTCRAQRTVTFVEVNDGSCLSNMQCVLTPETEGYDQIDSINTGASVLVEGVVASSQGGKQKVELKVSKIIVIGESDPTSFPIQKKRASREFLRTVAHLRPRTNTFGAVARVRNALAYATHKFFQDSGFIWVSSPIITASDCEGAGEQFYVTTLLSNSAEGGCLVNSIPSKDGRVDWSQDFFCKPAFLTVSGQLNGETYASALSDVKYILENCKEDMDFFDTWVEKGIIDRLNNVAEKNSVQMSYSDAIKLLIGSNKKFEFPVKWGLDLQSEHERYITEVAFGGSPVIIRDYPKEIKAFYMRQNDDGKTVAAMDLLVPRVGELIGGSQREERLDYLEARLDESNLNKDSYWWYLDLRRYGSVPHAGFGLGFERLVQFATGIDNIRDAIPFPRVPGSAEF